MLIPGLLSLSHVTDVLEAEWGRHAPTSAVVQGAYASVFSHSEAEKEYNDVCTHGHSAPLTSWSH